jgi:hypothetical protein
MSTYTMTEAEPSSSGIELQSFSVPQSNTQSEQKLGISDPEDIRTDTAPPTEAVEALQRWNSSRIQMWRVFATFWAFFVVGMNDGSYGVSTFLTPFPVSLLISPGSDPSRMSPISEFVALKPE